MFNRLVVCLLVVFALCAFSIISETSAQEIMTPNEAGLYIGGGTGYNETPAFQGDLAFSTPLHSCDNEDGVRRSLLGGGIGGTLQGGGSDYEARLYLYCAPEKNLWIWGGVYYGEKINLASPAASHTLTSPTGHEGYFIGSRYEWNHLQVAGQYKTRTVSLNTPRLITTWYGSPEIVEEHQDVPMWEGYATLRRINSESDSWTGLIVGRRPVYRYGMADLGRWSDPTIQSATGLEGEYYGGVEACISMPYLDDEGVSSEIKFSGGYHLARVSLNLRLKD